MFTITTTTPAITTTTTPTTTSPVITTTATPTATIATPATTAITELKSLGIFTRTGLYVASITLMLMLIIGILLLWRQTKKSSKY